VRLAWATPPEWVAHVEREPLALLSDHAHCELKAEATARSLMARHADRAPLVEALAPMADEEREHFELVLAELRARGGQLAPQGSNPYAAGLHRRSAASRRDALLDRLLVARLIEARSLERFQLLAAHLTDRGLADLYRGLVASEAGHAALFGRLARALFPAGQVAARLAELVALEAELAAGLPFDHRVHSGPP
jgi:tRNA-(ms[2]io[6]A)-hydroxylase